MKSFLEHLNEEVLPTVQVADGGLDISKPAVRAAINAAIAGVVSQPAVTPYVVFNRLSKLLAQYHIVLPKRFLEGDKGVEVFEVKQFGHKMGMTDSGEFVNEVPSTHYLFLQYGILSPFGITYAKPVVGGMFKVMARLVDKEELDKLMDMAEITMAEEAEHMQAIAKVNAPKEPMHDITSDEKKKGNKAAVDDSQKGLAEASTKSQRDAMKRVLSQHPDRDLHSRITKQGADERAKKKSFASAKKEIKGLKEEERLNAWGQTPETAKQVRKQLRQERKAKAFTKAQQKQNMKEEEHIDEASVGKLLDFRNRAGKDGKDRDKSVKLAYAKLTGKAKVNAPKPKHPYMEETLDETHADNIRRKYREKEDSNDHTGNVHLLTRVFGKKKEQETSKEMLRKRDKQGYVSGSDSKKGYEMTKKYASRLDKLKEEEEKDKDPCWDDYEMVGMKKGKKGKPVPNCVLKSKVDEATDKDRELSKLASAAMSKGQAVKKLPAGRAQNAVLPKGMARGANIEKGRWSGHGKFDEERMEEGRMPPSVIRHRESIRNMTPEQKAKKFAGKSKEELESMARRHGYGPKSDEYSKHVKKEQIDEVSKRAAISAYRQKEGEERDTRKLHGLIKRKFGEKTAKHAERAGAADTGNLVRRGESHGVDRLASAKSSSEMRKTKDKKIHGQDVTAKKSEIKFRRSMKKFDKPRGHLPEETLAEKAPPGAKFKRMAKHIKDKYAEGGLTDVEKRKAFGATWKAYKREKGE